MMILDSGLLFWATLYSSVIIILIGLLRVTTVVKFGRNAVPAPLPGVPQPHGTISRSCINNNNNNNINNNHNHNNHNNKTTIYKAQ